MGNQNIPLDDRDHVIICELSLHVFIEEHLVELDGRTVGVDILLQNKHVPIDEVFI